MRSPNTQKRSAAPAAVHDHPEVLIWETTLASEAGPTGKAVGHHPDELTTVEGKALLTALAMMGTPSVTLTGGDPAMRHDLCALVTHARSLGLRVTIAAASSPSMSAALLRALRAAGLARLSVCIDGFNAATHDAWRQQEGSFAETLRVLGDAEAAGLDLKIETTAHAGIERHWRTMSYLVGELRASTWTVAFPPAVPAEGVLSSDRIESVLETLWSVAESSDFIVEATGAPQLARVRLQQRGRSSRSRVRVVDENGVVQGPRAMNDGCGVMFVSQVGDLSPSPTLRLPAGNVRTHDVVDVYRNDATFRALRDVDALDGKCGVCTYRVVCGGSRARAHARTGSLVAADPACPHVPVGYAAPLSA